jgi:tagaturonate reductase
MSLFQKKENPSGNVESKFQNALIAACVPAAFFAGLKTIDEMVNDPLFNIFIKKAVGEEFAKSINAPDEEKNAVFEAMLKRHADPAARHELLPLLTNVIPRWKDYILPAVRKHMESNTMPPLCLALSMTALIRCYMVDRKGQGFTQIADPYKLKESADLLVYFSRRLKGVQNNRGVEEVKTILSETKFWGMDLNTIQNFTALVVENLTLIGGQGVRVAIEKIVLV